MNPHSPQDPEDLKRLVMAMVLFAAGLLIWQFTFEIPRQKAEQQKLIVEQQQQQQKLAVLDTQKVQTAQKLVDFAHQPKITINSPDVGGVISLQGARLNSVVLKNYRQEVEPTSPPVELLQPAGTVNAYFIETGWVKPKDSNVVVPTSETLWQADSSELTPQKPVTLSWDNGQGQRFEIVYSLKGPFLFDVQQRVINSAVTPVTVTPYGYVNRKLNEIEQSKHYAILHEGPLGVLKGELTEVGYKQLVKEGDQQFTNETGWLGITDKYWLTALVPQGKDAFTGYFRHYVSPEGDEHYQADYLHSNQQVAAGQTASSNSLIFAGAKKLDLLETYRDQYNIPLFDRAVDFGHLYFLTKPIFKLLSLLHGVVGNFGLAIMLLTIIIKGIMFPLANKSYISMNEMKKLQPEMTRLKERYGDDKMKLQQEMMAFYKKEKINPASGCLPMVIQIPVFFALYKVLFVTLEMRHAPFVGFVRDLSAPDPTNAFNLFGLLDFTPPAALHLGLLAIMMGASMFLQQRLNPKPADPVQAKVMSFLPLIFTFIMASFPAGLLIYWTWSNTLSITQQLYIKKRYEKTSSRKLAAAHK